MFTSIACFPRRSASWRWKCHKAIPESTRAYSVRTRGGRSAAPHYRMVPWSGTGSISFRTVKVLRMGCARSDVQRCAVGFHVLDDTSELDKNLSLGEGEESVLGFIPEGDDDVLDLYGTDSECISTKTFEKGYGGDCYLRWRTPIAFKPYG